MNGKYSPEESEKRWQDFWQQNGTYRYDPTSTKPVYSIDTPPPTVSGNIHIGHIFSYTQAEIIARYKRMSGFNVFYPFGFDDNGLPTERLVEKEIGRKGVEMPREEFNAACLEITRKYRDEFKRLWISVGISADWGLEYSTISPLAQRVSQKSFLELYKNRQVVQRNIPALWCTECATSIAQAELDDKEVDAVFYDIAFKTATGTLTIATTRPELLPACVAVFVHPEDPRFASLVGTTVRTPLGHEVTVMTDDKVDQTKGSGAVMCCTYGDETDLFWKEKYDLPEKIILDRKGTVTGTGIEGFDGLYSKKARSFLVKMMRESGDLLNEKQISHVVKTHERCGTPMELLPAQQWFVDIMPIREKLLAAGDQIVWRPEYMKKRYIDWVENLKWNWCISRQRFFGIPTPVWYSKITGETILPDYDQLPVDPLRDLPRTMPAGHTADDLIPDLNVLDTWATSSLSPEINGHWMEADDFTDKILPMSLRPQAHDIIRTWAFYTIAKSVLHHDRIPFREIMISGHVLAKGGEKISKSKGNAGKSPEELIAAHSADALRMWACGASLGKNAILDEQEIINGRKLITKLWNVGNFIEPLLEGFDIQTTAIPAELELVDQHVLHSVARLEHDMKKHLEEFEFGLALNEFEKFFWHVFCDNYLEIIKDRMYNPENYRNGAAAKVSGQYALHQTLLSVLKLLAPFVPHITEEMYHQHFAKSEGVASVHLLPYAVNQFQGLSHSAEHCDQVMEKIFPVIEQVRKFKTTNKLKLSEPVELVEITGTAADIELLKQVAEDIGGVSKARKVGFVEGGEFEVEVIPN